MTVARALWIVAPGRAELRTETLRAPASGEMLFTTLASGISRGTEALVLAGRVPPSQHAAMRAPMMAGAFPFPVKYGYCAVAAAPDGVRRFVLHPHQDRFVAPDAVAIRVPDAVPTARATLAANMETALNLVWDAAPLPGERVLVVGGGVLGLLAASLIARIPGTGVTVVDIDRTRAALAAALGCRFAPPDASPRGAGADRARLRVRGRLAPRAEPRRRSRRASSRRAGSATARRRCRSARRSMRAGCASSARRSAPSRRRCADEGAVPSGSPSRSTCWPIPLSTSLLEPPTRFAELPAAYLAPARRRPLPCRHLLDESTMFSLTVADHIMIAHSFRGEAFGPAQRLHGATFAVEAEFRAAALDEMQLLIDIGLARTVLRQVLDGLDYRNLDDEPALSGRNTTTEYLAFHIFGLLARACRDGALGEGGRRVACIKVLLRESPLAWAAFEGEVA